MSDISQPLHIPKDALIARLQEVSDEATQKRADAAAKAQAARQTVLDAVAQLSPDQVANILDYKLGGYGDSKVVEFVEDVVKNDKFKTIDSVPTGIETVLERTIRVLGLASDSTIEVTPSDSIYSYL